MYSRRALAATPSSARKRNLAQREASGSMMLRQRGMAHTKRKGVSQVHTRISSCVAGRRTG